MKTSSQIRQTFLDFWTSSPRNAKVVPNMSLVPNVDSTLLFVNSGMFPLAPYLGGQPHPLGTRLCNVQRCLRTNYDEMIEIGDNRHTLMFEMLGNWSLGDFTKAEQIPWIAELLFDKLGLDPHRLYVSVFAGDADADRDQEAIDIWQATFRKYGVEAEFSEDITNIPENLEAGSTWKYRIFPYPKKKNWWERAHAPGELGGPTSEMFYDMGTIVNDQDEYHINDDSGRFIEIGNIVFMEYKLSDDMKWVPLEQKNIDFGGGFERLVMIAQEKSDIFETDVYWPILAKVEEISGKQYKQDGKETEDTKAFRVIADHSRAATFIIADGVLPSNKDQGYILRRFIRRLVRFGRKLGIETEFTGQIAEVVVDHLQGAYPHLGENKTKVLEAIVAEEQKFNRTLTNGLKELENIKAQRAAGTSQADPGIDGKVAFYIYETFGFPLEMTLDELAIDEDTAALITKEFQAEELSHREQSRAGAEQKFKGGLADQSAEVVKLHTAHHLLLAALQHVVDPEIKQRGSNITGERLRIDFNFADKLTDEQISAVESLVNEKIAAELPVTRREMPREEAEKLGAQMEFGQKYPDMVSVYMIGEEGGYFSMEFCGGPHVENTSELAAGGKKFKIQKQESSGAGIRRIKAALI